MYFNIGEDTIPIHRINSRGNYSFGAPFTEWHCPYVRYDGPSRIYENGSEDYLFVDDDSSGFRIYPNGNIVRLGVFYDRTR